MKQKLQKIIDTYFQNDAKKYTFLSSHDLLIILDEKWESADFFHFLFKNKEDLENKKNSENEEKSEDEENSEAINPQKIYEDLIKNDTNKIFSNAESFEKNLNFIYFVKLETEDYQKYCKNHDKKLLAQAHLIEENKYYAKEKVIFYTDNLIYDLENDISNTDIGDEGDLEKYLKEPKNRLKVDLQIGLSFIKINFSNKNQGEKKIFQESFDNIIKDWNDEKWQIWNDFWDFNQKIIDINQNIQDDLDLLFYDDFDKNLWKLFVNWFDEYEKQLENALTYLRSLQWK